VSGEASGPAAAQAPAGVHQPQEWGQPGGQAHADLPVATQPSPGLRPQPGGTRVRVGEARGTLPGFFEGVVLHFGRKISTHF